MQNQFSGVISSSDIKSICESILKSSERTANLRSYNESGLSKSELADVPLVARWIDWVQIQKNLKGLVEKIVVEKVEFKPPTPKLTKADVVEKVKVPAVKEEKKVVSEKKKVPEKEPVKNDLSVSLLNLQVGVIRKAWNPPPTDRHKGEPEAVLNPKKKQLDKITPLLFTDDKGVATFKGIPFMTSGGPCTSSTPKATIE